MAESRHSKPQSQSIRCFLTTLVFSPPQRNSHQFLTHVNGPFQYFMFLYGVLTIERRNGRHISPSYLTGPASIFSTELCTLKQKEPVRGKKDENTGKFSNRACNIFSTLNISVELNQYLYIFYFDYLGYSTLW